MLERKAVFNIIPRLRNLSISEELLTKLTENYGKIKDQLLAWQFGYSILVNENPDLFERSMRLCTTNMQGASDLMEMAARLSPHDPVPSRILLRTVWCFFSRLSRIRMMVLGQRDRKYLDN